MTLNSLLTYIIQHPHLLLTRHLPRDTGPDEIHLIRSQLVVLCHEGEKFIRQFHYFTVTAFLTERL